MERPSVGLGVILYHPDYDKPKILLGLRKDEHGHGDNEWSLPGGHLELFESFEDGCKRETYEESGLIIEDVSKVDFTNDIWPELYKHYVTLFFTAKVVGGKLEVKEPEKCEKWEWFDLDKLPSPLFLPLDKLLRERCPA